MVRMSARVLQIGDEVKITHRDLRRLFGKIVDITVNEANIFLMMQDVTTTVPFAALQKYLKVGDEVCILEGDNQGVMGWVVNQDDNYVCVFNDRTGAEVNVLFLQFILLTFRPLLGRGFPRECSVLQLPLFLRKRIPGFESSLDSCTKACHEGGL